LKEFQLEADGQGGKLLMICQRHHVYQDCHSEKWYSCFKVEHYKQVSWTLQV